VRDFDFCGQSPFLFAAALAQRSVLLLIHFAVAGFLSTAELASVCSLDRSSFLLLLFSKVREGVNLVQPQERVQISLQ
jgi:hypothetical protein